MQRASIDELNRGAWAEALEQHKLVYPDERVVSFLAAHYSDVSANKDRKALDLGFGAGRHLRVLVDYGFQVAGIDYIKTAADAARRDSWRSARRLRPAAGRPQRQAVSRSII